MFVGRIHHRHFAPFVAIVAVAILSLSVYAGPVTDFDDVSFWVGSGSNQAALAIDWDGRSAQSDLDNALVWGFRWDGIATAADLFNAIVEADPRLYAKTNSPNLEDGRAPASNVAVYGCLLYTSPSPRDRG